MATVSIERYIHVFELDFKRLVHVYLRSSSGCCCTVHVCVVTSFGNPCAGRVIRGSSRSLLAKVLFIDSPMHLSLGPPGPRVLTGEDHKMLYPFPGPQSPVPCPPLKELTPWSPMNSMSCLLPLLVPTVPPSLVPCPRSCVPGPLSPLKKLTLKVCI